MLSLKTYKLILISIMVLAGQSCALFKEKSDPSKNMAYLYNPSMYGLHPNYSIYHSSASESDLRVRISTEELLFNKANSSGEYMAKVKVRYYLYTFEENVIQEIVDSATHIIDINLDKTKVEYLETLKLNVPEGNQYFLRIYLIDELRFKMNQSFMVIKKEGNFSSEYFNMVSKSTGKPLFTKQIVPHQEFYILSKQYTQDSIWVSYYKDLLDIPPVPYSVNQPPQYGRKADSTYKIAFTKNVKYSFNAEGLYLLHATKESKKGLCFYNFGSDFPKINDALSMMGPSKYLANTSETKDMYDKTNKKLAVDDFWLSLSGDIYKSKELIRVFFSRAVFANYYFTSDRPGWKTDRGMIYVVYGPADIIYKSATEEKWIYEGSTPKHNLTFVFKYNENPFTDIDYTLLRSDRYTDSWTEAVATWRKGKVYDYSPGF